MKVLKQAGSSDLSLPPDSYIYSLLPLSAQTSPAHIATLCSDDSVRIFDTHSFSLVANGVLKGVNESVTCLKRFSRAGDEPNLFVTTGRDGRVRFWDGRTGKGVMEGVAVTERQNKISLSALGCSSERNCAVAGAELEGKEGPGDAPIFVWDTRNLSKAQHVYTESHTDTITEILFHPSVPSLLLTASTDSLINIIDVTNSDEDEAILQVFNHKSALHHASFLSNSAICGMGTDETLSFFRLQDASQPDADVTGEENSPVVLELGDIRQMLDVEYLIDIAWEGTTPFLVGGKHSARTIDIIPFNHPSAANVGGNSLDWRPQSGDASRIRLNGGHGEEIVRDVHIADTTQSVFTCGEDGMVRAWKTDAADEEDAVMADAVDDRKKRAKAAKGREGRFKPY